jgi:hypothetical protein
MCIVEYADAYSYACDIVLHKHKQIVYVIMQPHFKTMEIIDGNILIESQRETNQKYQMAQKDCMYKPAIQPVQKHIQSVICKVPK